MPDDHAELSRLVRLYDDYANIGLKIGYDFSLKNIAFPRDLNESHDNAVSNFNFMEEERKEKKPPSLRKPISPDTRSFARSIRAIAILVFSWLYQRMPKALSKRERTCEYALAVMLQGIAVGLRQFYSSESRLTLISHGLRLK